MSSLTPFLLPFLHLSSLTPFLHFCIFAFLHFCIFAFLFIFVFVCRGNWWKRVKRCRFLLREIRNGIRRCHFVQPLTVSCVGNELPSLGRFPIIHRQAA